MYISRIIKSILTLIVIFFTQSSISQNFINKEVDSLYKEDQFYMGITYNILTKPEVVVSQSGFSSGFHFGFIKDMPVNKNRNVAIGMGLGYSINTLNQDLLISKNDIDVVSYTILEDNDTYTKNRLSNHLIELPFEFRWRTSNATDYNFWRIYTGFKLSYNLIDIAKHKGDLGNFKHTNIEDVNEFQYGLTLSAGYNTWNIYLYYALNPVFLESAKVNNQVIDNRLIKIGLMFYIL